MNTLPQHRQMLAGRTHSSVWCPATLGASIEVYRRRARLVDRLWWLASLGLLASAAFLVWG